MWGIKSDIFLREYVLCHLKPATSAAPTPFTFMQIGWVLNCWVREVWSMRPLCRYHFSTNVICFPGNQLAINQLSTDCKLTLSEFVLCGRCSGWDRRQLLQLLCSQTIFFFTFINAKKENVHLPPDKTSFRPV